MTTLGQDRILSAPYPVPMPSYFQEKPNRRMISAVKDGIYHPCLPTFRRMDMDTERSKLPDDHCRTSTPCSRQDFLRMNYDGMEAPREPIHCMNITDTGRALNRYYTTPRELSTTREGWSEFLTRCPERYQITVPDVPPSRDLHFVGYGVRYLRPDLTRDHLMRMRTEPSLHRTYNTQRPVPALDMEKYRNHGHPNLVRSVSSMPFKLPGKNYYRFV